jgi:hypothetical protein
MAAVISKAEFTRIFGMLIRPAAVSGKKWRHDQARLEAIGCDQSCLARWRSSRGGKAALVVRLGNLVCNILYSYADADLAAFSILPPPISTSLPFIHGHPIRHRGKSKQKAAGRRPIDGDRRDEIVTYDGKRSRLRNCASVGPIGSIA